MCFFGLIFSPRTGHSKRKPDVTDKSPLRVNTGENMRVCASNIESGRQLNSLKATMEKSRANIDEERLKALGLMNIDVTVIESGQCLNDRVINAAQALLKEKFNMFNGLHDTVIVAAGHVTLSGESEVSFVQIFHDEPHQHWLVATNVNCNRHELLIYCSSHLTPSSQCMSVITRFVKFQCHKITIHVMNVARQSGAKDCGLFAIAYAETLLRGMDPVNVVYRQGDMRSHLRTCLTYGDISAFPTVSLRTTRKRTIRSLEVELFCVCRASNAKNESMIQCDHCGNWFHPNCVGMQDSTFDALLQTTQSFSCESCRP
jgi:hypothetical protein